jgi:hypothetical protein
MPKTRIPRRGRNAGGKPDATIPPKALPVTLLSGFLVILSLCFYDISIRY